MTATVPTDLHGHSLLSDGRATPEEYVGFRAERGYEVVALSDHDVLVGVRRAAAAARAHGVELVPAAEITSFIHFGTEQAEQIHVLAYFPPSVLDGHGLEHTWLYARSLAVQRHWRAFVLNWLRGLSRHDRFLLDPDDALPKLSAAKFPALQSTINLIAERNRMVYESFRRCHVKFWNDDATLFGWSPEEAIDAIRADGALDVVAHPVRVRDKQRMDRVLAYASGLEVYTSRHNAAVAARFLDYAETHGKYWTASSDDHQHSAYVAPPDGTPVRTLERIGVSPAAWERTQVVPQSGVADNEHRGVRPQGALPERSRRQVPASGGSAQQCR